MRCEVHCPKEGGAAIGAFGVVAAIAAVYVLAQLAVVLAVAAAVVVALGAVSVPVTRRVARRSCVRYYDRRVRVPVAVALPARAQTALPRGTQLAIEGKTIRVTPDMVVQDVREEAR